MRIIYLFIHFVHLFECYLNLVSELVKLLHSETHDLNIYFMGHIKGENVVNSISQLVMARCMLQQRLHWALAENIDYDAAFLLQYMSYEKPSLELLDT